MMQTQRRLDLLLVNPNLTFQKKKDRVPNVGLLCIASYLKANGYAVAIIDLVQNDIDYLLKAIQETNPLAIGFSCTSAESYYEATQVSHIIKGRFSTPIITGGQHVIGLMSMAKGDLHPVFDCHISGPGEISISKILDTLRLGDAKLSRQVYAQSLDNFFYLDYSLYPNYKKFIPCVEVVRGCCFNCRFCNASNMRQAMGYQYRNVNEIAHEIERIVEFYGEDSDVFLFGPVFGNDYHRTKALLKILRHFPKSLKYTFNMRVDSSWRSFWAEIVDLNIRSVFFGMESASQTVLQLMGKTTNPSKYVDEAHHIFRAFSEQGIPFFVSLILGYWGENRNTVKETQQFLEENKNYVKAISVNRYQIYPGSYDYGNFEALLKQYDTDYHIDPANKLITLNRMNDLSGEEIDELCNALSHRYNSDVDYYRLVRDWRFFI